MLGELEKPLIFALQFHGSLGGGIGRRAGFKIQFLRECGFDSRPRYQIPSNEVAGSKKETRSELARERVFAFVRTAGSGDGILRALLRFQGKGEHAAGSGGHSRPRYEVSL